MIGIAFATLACIGALELAFSRFTPRIADNFFHVYRFNHTWMPNGRSVHSEWIARNPDFPLPYIHTYNKQGWIADHDADPRKSSDTFRIFYVGDSFTEGTAPMDQSVPSRVGQALRALARTSGLRVEVINTGTSSYSPAIFYVLTRYMLLDYSPDLIVVNVDMTDVDDDWMYSSTLIRDQAGDPWAVPHNSYFNAPFLYTAKGFVKSTFAMKLQIFLLRNSYIYTYFWLKRPPSAWGQPESAPPGVIRGRFGWCREHWSNDVKKDVTVTFDHLRRLAKLCRERKVKLMLTGVPHYGQFAGKDDGTGAPSWSNRPHRELGRLARELDIPYLDSHASLARLVRGTSKGRYYYWGDDHFNPRGYEIWANAHLDFLTDKKHGLLPQPLLDIPSLREQLKK